VNRSGSCRKEKWLTAGCRRKVIDIMGSDQALSEGGTPFASGIDAYTVGIFGQPSATTPWMLQFGGHHLALNITIMGARGVLGPTSTGAQPGGNSRPCDNRKMATWGRIHFTGQALTTVAIDH
jgi:hypothetical protein